MSNNHRSSNTIEGDFRALPSTGKAGPSALDAKGPSNLLRRSPSQNQLNPGDTLGNSMLASVTQVKESDAQYLQRPRSLLARVFGIEDPHTVAIEKHNLRQCEQVCDFLQKKLGLECEALYLRCQDDVNTWLARNRIAARNDLIDFATRHLQDLRERMEERRTEFTVYLRRRTQRLEQNRDMELLVDAEVADLQEEMRQHLEFIREMEEMFRAAVRERIG